MLDNIKTFKDFEHHFKPLKFNDKRNFNKYLLKNDRTAKQYALLNSYYRSNIFTATREDKELILKPGKIFHLEDSYFIVCAIMWEDEEQCFKLKLK